MDHFMTIGYYICDMMKTPNWLHGPGRQMLSVSGCLGEQHPRWECFMGGWCKGESEEYQKRLQMDEEQYREFTESVNRLFDAGRLDVDSRFLYLSDAQYFYERFYQALSCRLVSVSTTPEYFELLEEELKGSNSGGVMNGEPDRSLWIGSDILGWDISGFHSFLCNSLQEILPEARFNDMGLLENSFYEVVDFVCRIEGKGEPVEWIPCRLGNCVNEYERSRRNNDGFVKISVDKGA